MIINAAIQLLPFADQPIKYELIDNAITLIKKSGLPYKVCPFETVVEGESRAVYELIHNIQTQTLSKNCDELIINVKVHAATRNLHYEEKLVNYQ